MIKTLKRTLHPVLKKLLFWYFSKTRTYKYQNISVDVLPSVFPPHFTISTKILLDYLDTQNINEQRILELGCGSGVISIFCAKKGAIVTASDINRTALKALEVNANKNDVIINVKYSDLFDDINPSNFEYIIINPPYYPKNPKKVSENAWYCGENFEYFYKLFKQLSVNIDDDVKVLMIVSDTCNIDVISRIASENNLTFKTILEYTKYGETHFVYLVLK